MQKNKHTSETEAQKSLPKGLIILQIDGLAFTHFSQALKLKKFPFLRCLLNKQNYNCMPVYSGMPSTTPAVQAEIFYGIKGAVPAFHFKEYNSGICGTMFDPGFAGLIQGSLEKLNPNLLEGGSSYSNIYSGGATNSTFCPGSFKWNDTIPRLAWLRSLAVILLYPLSVLRVLTLLVSELFLSISDFFHGLVSGKDFLKELKFVPTRVIVSVFLRELVSIFTTRDIAKGVPVIYSNFLGYDEQAHRRGPDSAFAYWTLKGIDRKIRSIFKHAKKSTRRDYEVWIVSDHGQESVESYDKLYGRSVEEVISEILGLDTKTASAPKIPSIQNQRVRWLLRNKQYPAATNQTQEGVDKIVITAMGPIGHIYGLDDLDQPDLVALANELVSVGHIPFVLVPTKIGSAIAVCKTGIFNFPQDAVEVLGSDHPYLLQLTKDILHLAASHDSGSLIFFGWCAGQSPISFALESGAHGGAGPFETQGFIFAPLKTAQILRSTLPGLRPFDLRDYAMEILGRADPLPRMPIRERELRVATYNVRICTGIDGVTSPKRTAEIIEQLDADFVGLQELDSASQRTGFLNQLEIIATQLDMHYYFFPTIKRPSMLYGIGILSKHPFKIVKCSLLPCLSGRLIRESRAVIWATCKVGSRLIHFFNTHLSLSPHESLFQINALMGPHWLGSLQPTDSLVVCGDLNATPNSRSYNLIRKQLLDVQTRILAPRPRATWPSRFPFRRIDHIFVSKNLPPENSEVLLTRKVRLASDHAPLVATLRL